MIGSNVMYSVQYVCVVWAFNSIPIIVMWSYKYCTTLTVLSRSSSNANTELTIRLIALCCRSATALSPLFQDLLANLLKRLFFLLIESKNKSKHFMQTIAFLTVTQASHTLWKSTSTILSNKSIISQNK